jgi:hypothetical protein
VSLRELLSGSFSVGSRLRRLGLGAVLAAAGTLGFAIPAASSTVPSDSTVAAVIVNRSKKEPKLVLQVPGSDANYGTANHRSHASHASHKSHSSHSSHRSGGF